MRGIDGALYMHMFRSIRIRSRVLKRSFAGRACDERRTDDGRDKREKWTAKREEKRRGEKQQQRKGAVRERARVVRAAGQGASVFEKQKKERDLTQTRVNDGVGERRSESGERRKTEEEGGEARRTEESRSFHSAGG